MLLAPPVMRTVVLVLLPSTRALTPCDGLAWGSRFPVTLLLQRSGVAKPPWRSERRPMRSHLLILKPDTVDFIIVSNSGCSHVAAGGD